VNGWMVGQGVLVRALGSPHSWYISRHKSVLCSNEIEGLVVVAHAMGRFDYKQIRNDRIRET
jgi:hypothetical protein